MGLCSEFDYLQQFSTVSWTCIGWLYLRLKYDNFDTDYLAANVGNPNDTNKLGE